MYEIFSELEISAVVHINTNNTTNNNHLDLLEKRKSFADMRTVQVTNTNLQSMEVGKGLFEHEHDISLSLWRFLIA